MCFDVCIKTGVYRRRRGGSQATRPPVVGQRDRVDGERWGRDSSDMRWLTLLIVSVALVGTDESHAGAPFLPPMATCSSGSVVAEYASLGTSGGRDALCRDADKSVWTSRGGPGTPCKRSIDCQPACCACPTPGRAALTSWCKEGTCATFEQACCALLGTPTLSCGNRQR